MGSIPIMLFMSVLLRTGTSRTLNHQFDHEGVLSKQDQIEKNDCYDINSLEWCQERIDNDKCNKASIGELCQKTCNLCTMVECKDTGSQLFCKSRRKRVNVLRMIL